MWGNLSQEHLILAFLRSLCQKNNGRGQNGIEPESPTTSADHKYTTETGAVPPLLGYNLSVIFPNVKSTDFQLLIFILDSFHNSDQVQDKSVAWDRLERHIADEIAFWSKPESRYQRLIDASNAALRNAEKKALADYRAKVQDFENRKARNAGDSLPLK